jgi:hypothetical protein
MGANSVVNVRLASPNKFSCLLAPTGSPLFLNVDLMTLNRRQERVSNSQFDCSEVVREIVSPIPATAASTNVPIMKEVETTSLYAYNAAKDQITCQQRSASFLVPSQTNPLATQLWQASQGRPVDVRFYNVVYTGRR